MLSPEDGAVLGGWQFGTAAETNDDNSDGVRSSDRVYAVGVDEESGDVIVGGYTTGPLFSANGKSRQDWSIGVTSINSSRLRVRWTELDCATRVHLCSGPA